MLKEYRHHNCIDQHTKEGSVTRFLLKAAIVLGACAVLPVLAQSKPHVVHVASSATISPILEKICKEFKDQTDYECNLVSAPTGHLYAHVMHGANYDVLLSSNEDYVQGLINAEKVDKDSRFTLAIGRVVLWSGDESLSGSMMKKVLDSDNVHIAMANPGSTPYGKAAKEILQRYNLWYRKQDHITFGRNLGQTYNMIANKQVKLGFVAISQLNASDRKNKRYWEPELNAHRPVIHEAVSLKKNSAVEGTQAFLKFLRSDATCQLIQEAGYFCRQNLPPATAS